MASSFNRPKTSREEAAEVEKAKREAEMAAIFKRRQQQSGDSDDDEEDLTPAEIARKKREEEMAALRKARGGENNELRKRLQDKGGGLITDMDAWRADQIKAKNKDKDNKNKAASGLHRHQANFVKNKTSAEIGEEEDRKNKADAASNLHGHKGVYTGTKKTAADLDKEAYTQAQKDEMERLKQLKLDGKNYDADVGETVNEPVSASVKDAAKALDAAEKAELEAAEKRKSGVVIIKDSNAPSTTLPKVQYDISDAADAEEEKSRITLKVPTYTRIDIKFSFGLIVRSTAADGFNGENLRDNETLKKCMEGTSKILLQQMPSPPDVDKLLEENSSATSIKIQFPQAYYEPTFEPTVISIEEDTKNKDSGKVTAKGNKRTLVKASFPVFMRDEEEDDESQKRSARMLKETKTTVFKALRSAVSGGSFLR